MNSRVIKALHFATVMHEGQYRKDKITPYIVHPFEVYDIVKEHTDNEDILVAALLHDILEDTVTTYEDLYHEFNQEVAKLVESVSNAPRKHWADWREGKMLTYQRWKIGGEGAAIIKTADCIANRRTILEEFENGKSAEQVFKNFHKPIEDQFWFYVTSGQALYLMLPDHKLTIIHLQLAEKLLKYEVKQE